MKTKILFVAILLFALSAVICAQEKTVTIKQDSLYKKFSTDAQTLQKQAKELNDQITAAQKELERIIGRLELATMYQNEEKKKLDDAKKPAPADKAKDEKQK
jgi:uncharacterized coiled-coil protein SlyX